MNALLQINRFVRWSIMLPIGAQLVSLTMRFFDAERRGYFIDAWRAQAQAKIESERDYYLCMLEAALR